MHKSKPKKVVINADTSNPEVFIAERTAEDVKLSLDSKHIITFSDGFEWKKFVQFVLAVDKKENSIIINKPALEKGDMIQWLDGVPGLIVGVDLEEEAEVLGGPSLSDARDHFYWVYDIKWQDQLQMVSLPEFLLGSHDSGTWNLLSKKKKLDK